MREGRANAGTGCFERSSAPTARGPRDDPGTNARLLWSSAEGYHLEYRSSISSSVPAYHLVVDAEPGVDIAPMYLSSDVDVRTAVALRADLLVLAQRLENERRAPTGRASSKILELQMQTTLRCLADLVRRRRWEALRCRDVKVPAGADATAPFGNHSG